MTPKAHALLASIAAIKDAAADEYQALMLKLDALEAELEGLSIGRGLTEIRDGITRLSHSVISAHDTAAVLAEPMSIPSVPAPVAEPAPVVEAAPQADAGAEAPASSSAEQTTAEPGPGLYASRRKSDRTAV